MKLYSYWRSSASYRVRIALALKNIPYENVPVHLVDQGGVQNSDAYRALNPEGRVPLLVDGDFRLTQSLAIMDYLETTQPTPALIPAEAQLRARTWAFCNTIAADIQPLQNLSVLQALGGMGLDQEAKDAWCRHWITRGLHALELETQDQKGNYCFGDSPTYADCLLVPQVYNAIRFNCDTSQFARLAAVSAFCNTQAAFIAAHPDQQPDAQKPN